MPVLFAQPSLNCAHHGISPLKFLNQFLSKKAISCLPVIRFLQLSHMCLKQFFLLKPACNQDTHCFISLQTFLQNSYLASAPFSFPFWHWLETSSFSCTEQIVSHSRFSWLPLVTPFNLFLSPLFSVIYKLDLNIWLVSSQTFLQFQRQTYVF